MGQPLRSCAGLPRPGTLRERHGGRGASGNRHPRRFFVEGADLETSRTGRRVPSGGTAQAAVAALQGSLAFFNDDACEAATLGAVRAVAEAAKELGKLHRIASRAKRSIRGVRRAATRALRKDELRLQRAKEKEERQGARDGEAAAAAAEGGVVVDESVFSAPRTTWKWPCWRKQVPTRRVVGGEAAELVHTLTPVYPVPAMAGTKEAMATTKQKKKEEEETVSVVHAKERGGYPVSAAAGAGSNVLGDQYGDLPRDFLGQVYGHRPSISHT